MIKWAIYRLHWLLGITAGVVLSVMGVTGAMMGFEDEIMTVSSHGIVDVPVRTADPVMSPDTLLTRFIEQSPGSIPVKLTLFPEPGKSARLIYRPRVDATLASEEDNTDGTFLNPYTGVVLGKAAGERFFDTVRSLHRYLLLPHNRGGVGRPITTFASGCLVFFALSGLYLRWPRRVLDWRAWLKPDLGRRGRNLYWSLHSVAGTWLFLVFLVFAITGPTFAYDTYRDDLTALLTWTNTPPPQSTPQGAPANQPGGKPAPLARLDVVWAGFQAAVHTDVTTVLFSVSQKTTRTVTVRYLTRSSPHYRAYNEITLDRDSGAVINHILYARQSLGKQISIGMLAVHRGRVFGTAGTVLFMFAALMVPFFCITGYLLYLDRRRKKADTRAARLAIPVRPGATPTLPEDGWDILIAFASQSGTAERIAWQSASELTRGGRAVRVERLAALDVPRIKKAQTLLVVASTFGSGEPPDAARAFARRVLSAPADLSGLRGGVLALGHRGYPDFCGFGRMLDRWLHSSGVESLFPLIEMDAADPAALASWRQQLWALGAVAQPDASWQAQTTQPWRLLERILVNPGSTTAEAYHLVLEAQPPAFAAWTAGDIAVITPRRDGEEAENPPTREYSISSIPVQGKLELLVRKTVLANGQLGLGSGWLTHYAAPGDTIRLRIRSNPCFHPPDTRAPMILIGAGTGLAGLRAHLLHRQYNGLKGAWLLFGERSPQTDRPHREQIESWMSDGTLSRCDLAFSRDSTRRQYVQHRLEEATSQVLNWVMQDGATIFVCGGLKMGEAVHAVLQKILGESHLDQMAAAGHYRRDVY